jgi:drug/metabolite transporter (DMT)-like permease
MNVSLYEVGPRDGLQNEGAKVPLAGKQQLVEALAGAGLQRIEIVGWASVIYYGAVATVIAYILWGHGALLIPASRTGIATAALPVSALVLSVLVLGEPLRAVHIAGCAAVIAGIIVGRQ